MSESMTQDISSIGNTMYIINEKKKTVELRNIPRDHYLSKYKHWYKFLVIIERSKKFSKVCWLCDKVGNKVSLVL